MSDMTNDPAASYGEREPMLSHDQMCDLTWAVEWRKDTDPACAHERGINDASAHYEALIADGTLIKRDELVAWLKEAAASALNSEQMYEKVDNEPCRAASAGFRNGVEHVIDHLNKKP